MKLNLMTFGALLLCAQPTVSIAQSASSLPFAEWRIEWLREGPVSKAQGQRAPSIRVDSLGYEVVANFGCNRFGAPFEMKDSTLRFGALVTTNKRCPEQLANEQALIRTFPMVRGFAADAEKMTWLNASGEPVATFIKAPLTASRPSAETLKGSGWSQQTQRYLCEDEQTLDVNYLTIGKRQFAVLLVDERSHWLLAGSGKAANRFDALTPNAPLRWDRTVGTLGQPKGLTWLRNCKPL